MFLTTTSLLYCRFWNPFCLICVHNVLPFCEIFLPTVYYVVETATCTENNRNLSHWWGQPASSSSSSKRWPATCTAMTSMARPDETAHDYPTGPAEESLGWPQQRKPRQQNRSGHGGLIGRGWKFGSKTKKKPPLGGKKFAWRRFQDDQEQQGLRGHHSPSSGQNDNNGLPSASFL